MIKTLYLFRHGETDWNKELRLQGSTDIPLNETGRTQAQSLQEFFVSNPVEIVFSSDLSRARETAQIAVAPAATEICFDPRLRETNLGHAEGLTVDEVIQRFGEEAWLSWRGLGEGMADYRFPGGESKREHLARLLNALHEIVQTEKSARIGVSTHGGAMRRLIHHFRPELQSPFMVTNCSIYEVRFEVLKGDWTVDIEPKFSPPIQSRHY